MDLLSPNNPPYFFSFSSSCPRGRVNLPYSQIASTAAAYIVCVRNISHLSEPEPTSSAFPSNQLEDALQSFDTSLQAFSGPSNHTHCTGYLENSELDMMGTNNFTRIDHSQDLVITNQSMDMHSSVSSTMDLIPDRLCLIRVLSHCALVGSLELGRRFHASVVKIGVDRDMFVATSLVNMYAKCGDIENARDIFDRLSESDIVSCNSLITGYAANGLFDQALNFFVRVLSMGVKPSHYTLSIVLSICGRLLAITEGKQLHAYIVKMQYLSNTAVANALLAMYSKCGMMKKVDILFERLHVKNFISWTTAITGSYQQGHFERALRQFYCMRDGGIKPNEYTFAIALASCGGIKHHNNGHALHTQVIKNGMVSGVFVGTAIVGMYSGFGEMSDAEKQFEYMGSTASDVSWNALIGGYSSNGKTEEAMEAFCRMLSNGISCNQFTYSIVLKVCSSLPSLASCEQIHCQAIKTKCESSLHVGSSLIELYAKCGSLENAERVFNQMRVQDAVAWNSMIKAYSQNGYPRKAISLFKRMIGRQTRPTSATFLAVLSACSHSGLVQQGQEIFESMVKDYGITPEETHYSCMVDLLGRAGQLEAAQDFLASLPVRPTTSMWRPLLAACRCHCNLQRAEFVAGRILEIDPGDPTVYVTLSNMYAEVGRWDDVEKQRKLMEHRGVKKEPGRSWIEVNNRMFKFFSGDTTNTKTPEIYEKLGELVRQIKDMGYVPDRDLVHHQEEKQLIEEDQILRHSEKLAVCFGLISLPTGIPIRIFKNLRICRDCHSAMKYISRITKRDIVIRDNYRFHYFKHGCCSCGDYW